MNDLLRIEKDANGIIDVELLRPVTKNHFHPGIKQKVTVLKFIFKPKICEDLWQVEKDMITGELKAVYRLRFIYWERMKSIIEELKTQGLEVVPSVIESHLTPLYKSFKKEVPIPYEGYEKEDAFKEIKDKFEEELLNRAITNFNTYIEEVRDIKSAMGF